MEWTNLVTGLQHLGVPTQKFGESLEFYRAIGFRPAYETAVPSGERVAFLELSGVMIELYESQSKRADADESHIALDVKDVRAAYELAQARGLAFISGGIVELPFWERGVRFFIVEGPNRERIEFNQKL